jgi:hypothetical protein
MGDRHRLPGDIHIFDEEIKVGQVNVTTAKTAYRSISCG